MLRYCYNADFFIFKIRYIFLENGNWVFGGITWYVKDFHFLLDFFSSFFSAFFGFFQFSVNVISSSSRHLKISADSDAFLRSIFLSLDATSGRIISALLDFSFISKSLESLKLLSIRYLTFSSSFLAFSSNFTSKTTVLPANSELKSTLTLPPATVWTLATLQSSSTGIPGMGVIFCFLNTPRGINRISFGSLGPYAFSGESSTVLCS